MGDLRIEIANAAHDALEAAGGDVANVRRGEIVKQFLGRGVSRATLFRWLNSSLGAALPLVPAVKSESRPPVFNIVPGAEVPGLSDVMGPGAIGLVEAIKSCIQASQDVMAHSRHANGKVRLGKTLIAASEHLRRTLETAAKVHETMVSIQKIDLFYAELKEALRDASPETRSKVLDAIDAVNAKWLAQV